MRISDVRREICLKITLSGDMQHHHGKRVNIDGAVKDCEMIWLPWRGRIVGFRRGCLALNLLCVVAEVHEML